MNDSPIGFFDSGVGGISVLKHAVEIMPEENYIYFGDSENAPFGTKSRDEVFKLTYCGIDFLLKQGCKAIVIACNTATSIAVDALRKELQVPIISIEPAIKPALEQTDGKVLLLATNVTLASERVNKLISIYDTDKRVIKVSCCDLAEKIEKCVLTGESVKPYLEDILAPYRSINATAAVLGCTHYPFVADIIGDVLCDIKIFDGIDGTVMHLKNVLIENNIKNTSALNGIIKITSSSQKYIGLYEKMLNGGKL